MESKENELVVETRGHCFICLNHTTLISGENKHETSVSVQSIQFLSKYLKLDRGKVFQGPVPSHLLEKVERSRLKVELCSECSTLNDKLTELFEGLERIEMEIAFRLSCVSDKISASEQSGRMELITKILESSKSELNVDLLGKLEIAKVLREETNKKCSIKLSIYSSTPKVQMEKTRWKKPNHDAKKFDNENDMDTFGKTQKTDKIKKEIYSCPAIKSNDINDYDNSFEFDAINASENEYGYSSPSSHSPIQFNSIAKEEIFKKSKSNLKSKTNSISVKNKMKGITFSKTATKNKLSTVPLPIKSGEIINPGSIVSKRIINPDNGRHKCQICSKEYIQYENFIRHYKSAHMNVSYTCPVSDCGKTFSQRINYETHYKSVHLKIRYRCKICKKTLSRKDKLADHMKRVHKRH